MTDDLEQLLSRQTLREPSPGLDDRVAESLGHSPVNWRIGFAAWATGGAAIAAGLLLLAGSLRDPGPSASDPRPGPPTAAGELRGPAVVRVEQVWSQVTSGELIVMQDDEPMHPVLVQRLRQTRWIDPQDNIRIEMTVPDDRLVLVRASIQ